MSLQSWLQNLCSALSPGQSRGRKKRGDLPRATSQGLHLEALEERCVLASSVWGDFNNDGHNDVLTGHSSAYEAEINVELSNDDGSLRSPYAYFWDTGREGNTVVDMVADDFNADGNLDLAASVAYGNGVSVLLGNGQGWFHFASQLFSSRREIPLFVLSSDLNHDGRADLAWVNPGLKIVDVALNRGDGTFLSVQSYATAEEPWQLAVADSNGDGHSDLVTGNSVLLGNGDGTFQTPPPPPPLPSLRINDVSVVEGHTGTVAATFTVTLSAASTETVTVFYGTSYNTAIGDIDYQVPSGAPPLTFAPGQTSNTITVLVNGDHLGEPDESFFVVLFDPTNAAITDGHGVGTIVNDDLVLPTLSISDVSGSEGNTAQSPLAFAVTLSSASDGPVTVDWATANGTASAGSDYQAASGTLIILAGQTTGTITVLVNGDRLAEASETFVVNLSNPTNATIGDGQGVGTITDDEPRISIGDVMKAEGRRGKTTLFTFTVTLSAPSVQPVTMSYRTVNGTATTAGGDYVSRTGTLTFAPGQTSKTITIEVKGDSKHEGNETFYLDLFGLSSNASFTKNRGIGTILNDD